MRSRTLRVRSCDLVEGEHVDEGSVGAGAEAEFVGDERVHPVDGDELLGDAYGAPW